jgi:hypothetical protein
MMSFGLLSRKRVSVTSTRWIESNVLAGVRFSVREPSLAQRIELTRRLHELTMRNDFLRDGNELQQLELTLAELLVQKALIEWGLVAIEGLTIDGKQANPGLLVEAGPEELVAEIAAAIKHECGLNEEERKN